MARLARQVAESETEARPVPYAGDDPIPTKLSQVSRAVAADLRRLSGSDGLQFEAFELVGETVEQRGAWD